VFSGKPHTEAGTKCLRYNEAVVKITGIELDYDAKKIPFDDAIAVIKEAGLAALLFTSSSYTDENPKWRILLPTSKPLPPAERSKFVARMAGLFGSDIFSSETWTLSQSYYYGCVTGRPQPRIVITDGDHIDLRDDLDDGAISKVQDKAGTTADDGSDWEELISNIITGDNYHTAIVALAAKLFKSGMSAGAIVNHIRALMDASTGPHDDRWEHRRSDIPRAVAWAKKKYERESKSTNIIRAADVVIRPKDWLWEGHLMRGSQEMVTGIPGLGKSQVQICYVACVTTGRPWPNGAAGCAPANVIMMTAEDALDQEVIPRLVAAGANLDRVHIIKSIRSDDKDRQFLLSEDLDELERAIAEVGSVGMVTVDPITAYMGGKMDSHKTTEVRSQLGPLKDLAERANVAVSTITHPPKSAGGKAIDHFIGSQAFIAAARIGHVCINEFEVNDHGVSVPTGRVLFANAKNNPHREMPTLAYRIVEEVVRQDTTVGIITAPRVEWDADPVDITADEAVDAAAKSGKVDRSVEVEAFLLEMTRDGPVPMKRVDEEAKKRGISPKRLRTAREKGFVTKRIEGNDNEWELTRMVFGTLSPQGRKVVAAETS
jgi:AAA domain